MVAVGACYCFAMDLAFPHGLAASVAAPFVGSFLGLVAARHGTGRTILTGRSACDSCGRTLAIRDLVPLASWIALRGRCRHCGARIDPIQPAIEAGALIAALAAAATLPGALVWVGCGLAWWLIAIAAIDWRHLEIPDRLSLPLAIAGLAVSAIGGREMAIDSAIGAVAGFAAFAAIAWGYRRLRGRTGLGEGDARLMAAAGAWVGWQGLAAVALYGAGTALVWALVQGAVRRRLDAEAPVPFGPFLGLGIWIAWMWGAPLGVPPWTHL